LYRTILKIALLIVIQCYCFISADLTLTVDTLAVDLGRLNLEEGFHGAAAGNIQLTIGPSPNATADAYLYAAMTRLLINESGVEMPSGLLRWQGWWASTTGVDQTSANFVQGDTEWIEYKEADDIVVRIDQSANSDVSVSLGTQLKRVPAVQPQGIYTTAILFTVSE